MRLTVCRSDDAELLDALVRNFRPGVPVTNQAGQRIGSMLAVWREGDTIVADVECVPGDARRVRSVRLAFDEGE